MAARKVLLFIVEGQSDAAALEGVLSELLSNEKIRFHVVGADVTTQERRGTTSVKTAVNDLVRKFVTSYRLQPKDLLQVAHLMDTDGAFVPESAIREDHAASGFQYTTTTITAPAKDDVRKRNAVKSRNMLLLAGMRTTYKSIPYEAYYCSRNLEHVLHNIENDCTTREKLKLSDQFDERYRGRSADFLNFISTVPPAVPTNEYADSWEYIKKQGELRSLERGCNLHILLHKILSQYRSIIP